MKSFFVFAVTSTLASLLHSVSTTASDSTCSTNLRDIPRDAWDIISQSQHVRDIASTSLLSKEYNRICKDILERRKSVGDIPSFIPAVKVCMWEDDIECYENTLQYFSLQNRGKPWRLAQLPALAAQMGATKIFHKLNVTNTDPRWNKWMTRAISKNHREFLHSANLTPSIPLDPSYTRKDTPYSLLLEILAGLGFYDRRHPGMVDPTLITRYVKDQLFQIPDGYGSEVDWFDETMNDRSLYPSIEKLVNVTKIEDVKKRRQQFQVLKKEIQEMLQDGIFLIDDIIQRPHVTFLFWSMYIDDKNSSAAAGNPSVAAAPSGSSDDGGRVDFFQWLIDEGAPLRHSKMIERYSSVKEPIRGKYRRWIQLSSRYTSRTATDALVIFLKDDLDDKVRVKYYLSHFKDILEVDILHPSVLKEIFKIFRLDGSDAINPYLIENGFTGEHLQLLQAYAKTLPDYDEKQEGTTEFLKRMNSLLKKHKVQARYPDSPDWMKWWLELVI